jgi:Acetyltransferase (GNAT) family
VKEEAESFYSSKNLPSIFRISPLAPADCDVILEAVGYRLFDPSLVMISPLGDMGTPNILDLKSQPSREWLDGIAEANKVAPALNPMHDAIVLSITMPTAFATLRQDGVPIGFGLAVRERGIVGLFDIVISSASRGKAFGRTITQALMAWAHAGGAKTAYLQVRGSNRPLQYLGLQGSLQIPLPHTARMIRNGRLCLLYMVSAATADRKNSPSRPTKACRGTSASCGRPKWLDGRRGRADGIRFRFDIFSYWAALTGRPGREAVRTPV